MIKIKKIKKNIIIITSLICASAMVTVSGAFFTSRDSLVNTVNVGDVDIEISEQFTPPTNWDGSVYDKKVKIHNNSKSDALIRVALVPRWVDKNGNPYLGDANTATLNYASENIISKPKIKPIDKWVNGSDGYYYYNKIVSKGKDTVDILKSVSANIPTNLKERYKGKMLIVDVKAEAIVATQQAYDTSWSKIKDINIKNMLNSLSSKQ